MTTDANQVSIANAKSKLSEIVDGVAHHGARYIIRRYGRPVAAIVSIEDFAQLAERTSGEPEEPAGALALVGLWAGIPDEEIDGFVRDVRAARDADTGRPVELSS